MVHVKLKTIETTTKDGIVLRGYHLSPSNNASVNDVVRRRRFVQYMHGTRVFLPRKVPFFSELASEMRSDIIAFAYRGFSHSDGGEPDENGIRLDIEAITDYFEQVV